MLDYVDSLVNDITMYKLTMYYLIALLLIAMGLGAFGDLHYRPLYIAISTLILVAACWTTNKVFAYMFDAPTNSESSIITALILALIITPNPTGFGITFLLAVSGLAISSKYLLAIRKKHLFNPAAIAVVLTALGPRQSASWWVGTAVMLPFVLIGGVLIMRKIGKSRMVLTFFTSTSLATILYSLHSKANVFSSLHSMVLSSPLIFLGFVMLTEPSTSPPTAKKQTLYAALVGVLLPPQVHLFNFYSSPELALTAGNIFSYLVSPKTKLFPVLKQKLKIAPDSADFVFSPDRKFAYKPGQYMEWTLPHHKTDSRGNRRYFTLASSPTEPDLRIGVKFYEDGSSFKEALLDMDEETPIVASQLAGDFVLPKDRTQKIAFIAGGIGITPFRSMAKYLLDKDEPRTITLLYSVRTEADIAYKDLFEEARRSIGLKTIYAITGDSTMASGPNTHAGPITSRLIKAAVPDYLDRVFYVSGTHAMVVAMQDILAELGVSHHQIKVDFFPGYA
jgi:ferredoxin-NADP reductase/Na+-translocating ferredoxin:NAD+ oxidoreductase RnfD subunit